MYVDVDFCIWPVDVDGLLMYVSGLIVMKHPRTMMQEEQRSGRGVGGGPLPVKGCDRSIDTFSARNFFAM